jgi:ferredoxin
MLDPDSMSNGPDVQQAGCPTGSMSNWAWPAGTASGGRSPCRQLGIVVSFAAEAGGPFVMPMKVVVDFDLCEANAVCMDVCPEVFRVEEDDTLTVLIEEPPESLRSKVEEAVRLCPRQAISLRGD